MICARKALGGDDLAGKFAEAAFHPVANHCAADLLGDGKADAHRFVIVLAVADEEDEARGRRAEPAVGGKEVRALLKRG
jgi:hypothetical protein